MVNRGHRSLGCGPCRYSKIKCDQDRPACGRCVRTGRICSGYRQEQLVLEQRPNGSQLLRERLETWRPSSPRAASEATAAKTTRRAVVPRRSIVPPSPLQDMQISTDWTQSSVGLFMTEYVEGPDHLGTGWGHFEYLPDFYDKERSSYLTHAVNAAALTNAANTSSVTELERLARYEYGKALLGLGKAMSNPESMVLDETLAAMSVLSVYEVVAGQRPLTQIWHAHFFGQSTFLHLRRNDKEASYTSLFGITNRTLMWRDLVHGSGPYMCVADWPASTYKSWLGETSARLTLRMVKICGRIRAIFDTPAGDGGSDDPSIEEESFIELTKDAMDVHQALHEYFESTPDYLKSWTVSHRFQGNVLDARSSIQSMSSRISAVRNRGSFAGSHLRSRAVGVAPTQSYPSRIDVYPSKAVAFLYGALRAAWIHLARTLIDLRLFAQEHHYSTAHLATFEALYTTISELIEGICAAVPYSLGDIDQEGKIDTSDCSRASCFHLIWLLHRLCDIPGLDPGLRAWIVSVFERIGHRGVKRGHFLADLHSD